MFFRLGTPLKNRLKNAGWQKDMLFPTSRGPLLGCPCNLVTILSKLGCFTYLGDVSNLLIEGVKSSIY